MKFNKRIKLSLVTVALLAGSAYAQDQSTLEDVTVVADNTVTENSGLYTIDSMSSATKMNLSILDTPQSVSVVTSEQMEDFNLNTIDDALKNATGIEVADLEKDRTLFYSRGFSISNILTDGVGASLGGNNYINGEVDMALYDHIEVTRGATGISSNHGNPSATVNLVRKRPTKETQGEIKFTAGSNHKLRVEGDISGAISEDGMTRARLISSIEDTESYTDRYESKTYTIGAIVEHDVNDNNLLTAAISHSNTESDGVEQGGIYTSFLNQKDYDVSTSTAPDFGYRDVATTEAFLELDTNLSNDWNIKTTYTYKKIKHDSETALVDPSNYNSADATAKAGWFIDVDNDIEQHLIDMTVDKKYNLNGREHELIFGLNYIKQNYYDLTRSGGNYIDVDLDTWDGSGLTPTYSNSSETDLSSIEKSIFAATNYHVADDLSFLIGGKITNYSRNGLNSGNNLDEKQSAVFTPYASILYKITNNISTYASYTTTFNTQSTVDVNNDILEAEEGKNYEVGFKSSLFDDKLNLAVSVFKVKQDNVSTEAGKFSDNTSYYKSEDGIETKGFDIDISGRINDEINTSFGYTHLSIKDADGESTQEYMARNILKSSIVYSPSQIQNLKVGASASYRGVTNNSIDWRDSSSSANYEQKAYTIFNVMSSYQITKNAKISLNIDNITNEKYVNLYTEKAYVTYGAPRSFEVSFAYKF